MQELLQQIISKLDSLEKGQSSLEQGQKALEQGQKNLEQGQKALEQGQKNLEQGQEAIEKRLTSVEQGQKKLEIRMENEAFGPIRILSENVMSLNERQAATDKNIKVLVNAIDIIANRIDQVAADTSLLVERVTTLEKIAK
ncbi:MAG: hypothetical protein ABFD18_12710 [Syntrophomonas sp.]